MTSSKTLLPISKRGFVEWCKSNGLEDKLMGKVPHDQRNINAMANKYGVEIRKDGKVFMPDLAIALLKLYKPEHEFESEITQIWVDEAQHIPPISTKEQEPLVRTDTNWGDW